ncbi:dihydrofolate reductase family protein [Methanolobus bombayensis]|uniref:dihydrofolate reductase family protein n=1 Tax=Methanolobus bombayensis TaxID=38023 RepID=UPI001AE7C29B|nr:dihydrofolate reductase family protein [Methanolobus bombayensis]MBP1908515.1 dihydrofolate reductase [Methanolobus bombayensis]
MRKVILLITCSLDGFIASEDGNVDWLVGDEEYDFDTFLAAIDTLLMGYNTYHQVIGFGDWPYEDKECYVFTKQHLTSEDSNVIFSDRPVKTTESLIQEDGKAIWVVGGASIISLLLNSGLINELRIVIQPIILGKGIPLFKDIKDNIKLDLSSSHEYESGIVELVYQLHKV